MIHVDSPIPEPDDFETDCRQKGNDWLARNPGASTSKYPSYWREFSAQLERGFTGRCGYQAIIMPEGTVDHFISKKTDQFLTYEWSNYRYCGSAFNSAKQNHDDQVPDPFEVKDDWFEVILPVNSSLPTNSPLRWKQRPRSSSIPQASSTRKKPVGTDSIATANTSMETSISIR